MTTAQYRAHPAVNFSTLNHILRSPAHYVAALAAANVPTEDMIIGTAVHGMWLEGAAIDSVVAVKSEGMSFVTKEGKAWRAEQTLPIISAEAAGRVGSMMWALHQSSVANDVLRISPHRETPILFTYRGVECKALIDAWGDGPHIIDLKKTQDASQEGFARTVINRHYAMQAAMYCAALSSRLGTESMPSFTWQVVEDSDAPCVCHHAATHEWMDLGQRQFDTAITRLIECRESGKWPGYGDEIRPLSMPRWANQ
jgi:hypothetical protein